MNLRDRSAQAKSHGLPVGKPLRQPIGWRPRRKQPRPNRLYDVLRQTTHRAERTEAGPGREQGRSNIGPIHHPGPHGQFATDCAGRGGFIWVIGDLWVVGCEL